MNRASLVFLAALVAAHVAMPAASAHGGGRHLLIKSSRRDRWCPTGTRLTAADVVKKQLDFYVSQKGPMRARGTHASRKLPATARA